LRPEKAEPVLVSVPQVNLPVVEFQRSLAVVAPVQSLVGRPRPKKAEALA